MRNMSYILQQIIRIKILVLVTGVVMSCGLQRHDSVLIDGESAPRGSKLYLQGINAASEGDVKTAIDIFEQVIKTGLDDKEVYTNLGLQYLRSGDIDAAEKSFDTSLMHNPGDYVALNNMGVIKRKQGDFLGAEKLYQQAIDKNAEYGNAHHNIAILYDLYTHDLDKALQHYLKYQEINKNSDDLVGKWIVDLERRIASGKQ